MSLGVRSTTGRTGRSARNSPTGTEQQRQQDLDTLPLTLPNVIIPLGNSKEAPEEPSYYIAMIESVAAKT